MTPKEKAQELVYKFYPSVQWKLGQEDCLDRAKQCALIAVDEVLNLCWGGNKIGIKHWEDIKQEIELL
jgi:hypothetical protein